MFGLWQKKELMMNKLRVGIAGYGIVGKRRKNCVDLHPNMKMVAICDQYFDDNKTTVYGLNAYQSYSDLLKENLDIDKGNHISSDMPDKQTTVSQNP